MCQTSSRIEFLKTITYSGRLSSSQLISFYEAITYLHIRHIFLCKENRYNILKILVNRGFDYVGFTKSFSVIYTLYGYDFTLNLLKEYPQRSPSSFIRSMRHV